MEDDANRCVLGGRSEGCMAFAHEVHDSSLELIFNFGRYRFEFLRHLRVIIRWGGGGFLKHRCPVYRRSSARGPAQGSRRTVTIIIVNGSRPMIMVVVYIGLAPIACREKSGKIYARIPCAFELLRSET